MSVSKKLHNLLCTMGYSKNVWKGEIAPVLLNVHESSTKLGPSWILIVANLIVKPTHYSEMHLLVFPYAYTH